MQLPHIAVTAFSKTDLFLNYREFRTLQESHWSITNTDLTFNWDHHFTGRLNEKQPEAAIFSLPMRAQVDMNWPFSRKRNLKLDRPVKMQWHRLRRYQSCTLLVMGSYLFSEKSWYFEQPCQPDQLTQKRQHKSIQNFFFSVLNPGYSHMLNLRQSRTIFTSFIDSLLGQYSPEKFHPPHETKAPCFTFKTRTKYSFKDPTPSPNSYSLPPLIGPRGVNKASAPAYSLSGRSTIGGFSEDLQKVRVYVHILHNTARKIIITRARTRKEERYLMVTYFFSFLTMLEYPKRKYHQDRQDLK